MATNAIDTKKEQAFNLITQALMSIETEEVNGVEKTNHILDVLEQVLARVIAGSSLSEYNIEELCGESFDNVETMAKQFLQEEGMLN